MYKCFFAGLDESNTEDLPCWLIKNKHYIDLLHDSGIDVGFKATIYGSYTCNAALTVDYKTAEEYLLSLLKRSRILLPLVHKELCLVWSFCSSAGLGS